MRFHYSSLVAWLFFSGCSTVTSTAPLGDPVAAEEAKKLEGIWLSDDGEPIWVKHVKENELKVAGIEWRTSKFKLAEFTAFVTQDDERQYANMVDSTAQGEQPTYSFVRLTASQSEHLVMIAPKAEPFAQAVEGGKLSGTVTKKDDRVSVKLDSSAAKLNEFVEPSKGAEQFDVDAPIVLRRVRRFDESKP